MGVPEDLGTHASKCVACLRRWAQNLLLGTSPCSANPALGETTRNNKALLEEI